MQQEYPTTVRGTVQAIGPCMLGGPMGAVHGLASGQQWSFGWLGSLFSFSVSDRAHPGLTNLIRKLRFFIQELGFVANSPLGFLH